MVIPHHPERTLGWYIDRALYRACRNTFVMLAALTLWGLS